MKKIAEQGMLTKTYTSLTLSYEQKSAWLVLSKLKTCLQNAKRGTPGTNGTATMAAALREFAAADRFYRERAIEKHVIPAIRERIPQARSLLAERDALAAYSERILQHAREQLQCVPEHLECRTLSVLSAMEQYCQHLLERLRKEECELIPLAFRSLTPEEWFAIAVKCLPESQDYDKKAA